MPNKLQNTINNLLTKNKGILACDESINSANKSLSLFNIEQTPENRRIYREILLTTPDIENYISGVILFDETFWQKDSNNKLFTQTLQEKNIEIGIKLDKGLIELDNYPQQPFTQGLDNLEERILTYKQQGATFAKWRAVIEIDKKLNLPSKEIIELNCIQLALYAQICLQNELVPILEPEVLMEGNHTIEDSYVVTTATLKILFDTLTKYKIDLTKIILKTSMVIPGTEGTATNTNIEIAQQTLKSLQTAVPLEVPGIVFLSGGQTSDQALINLNCITQLKQKHANLQWTITFSYLRALIRPSLEIWQGHNNNIKKAQVMFLQTLQQAQKALQGNL